MTVNFPDEGQGGLPTLNPSELYVWLVEIEAFPPIYQIRFSDRRIANEVYQDFGKNREIKKLTKSYLELAATNENLEPGFFEVPVNLISICKISVGQRSRTLEKLQEMVNLSINLIPDLSLRWPFIYNLKEDKLASITERIAKYTGAKNYFVAKPSFISQVHETNLQIVIPK